MFWVKGLLDCRLKLLVIGKFYNTLLGIGPVEGIASTCGGGSAVMKIQWAAQ